MPSVTLSTVHFSVLSRFFVPESWPSSTHSSSLTCWVCFSSQSIFCFTSQWKKRRSDWSFWLRTAATIYKTSSPSVQESTRFISNSWWDVAGQTEVSQRSGQSALIIHMFVRRKVFVWSPLSRRIYLSPELPVSSEQHLDGLENKWKLRTKWRQQLVLCFLNNNLKKINGNHESQNLMLLTLKSLFAYMPMQDHERKQNQWKWNTFDHLF